MTRVSVILTIGTILRGEFPVISQRPNAGGLLEVVCGFKFNWMMDRCAVVCCPSPVEDGTHVFFIVVVTHRTNRKPQCLIHEHRPRRITKGFHLEQLQQAQCSDHEAAPTGCRECVHGVISVSIGNVVAGQDAVLRQVVSGNESAISLYIATDQFGNVALVETCKPRLGQP